MTISLEETSALADGLEVAVESGWSGAVTITQETSVLGRNPAHVGSFGAARERLAAVVVPPRRPGSPGSTPRRPFGLMYTRAYVSVMRIERWPNNAAIASRLMLRLIIRVASV